MEYIKAMIWIQSLQNTTNICYNSFDCNTLSCIFLRLKENIKGCKDDFINCVVWNKWIQNIFNSCTLLIKIHLPVGFSMHSLLLIWAGVAFTSSTHKRQSGKPPSPSIAPYLRAILAVGTSIVVNYFLHFVQLRKV